MGARPHFLIIVGFSCRGLIHQAHMLNYKNYLFNAETQKTRPDPISFAKIEKKRFLLSFFLR